MKNVTFSILLILGILAKTNANNVIIELNKGWQFKQARGNNWYNATVPGVVHTDLMDNKIIEDPFFRLNERSCQWVDKEDWEYKTTFDVSDQVFAKNNIRLIFKGLDTYADVFVNDTKILSANNMFREWNVNCKAILKKQGNILRVYFHSPIKMDIQKYDALPYHYPAINDQSENGGVFEKKVSPFARKAPYQYGWDWGPRLVTSGIWRPVFIEAWDNARINDVQIFQYDVNKKSAQIKAVIEILSNTDQPCEVAVNDAEHSSSFALVKAKLVQGLNKVTVEFTIKNPNLWWSNGLGTQYLYQFKTLLKLSGSEVDSKITKTGIRSIKLVTVNPNGEKTFHFELNGVPVFMKGANYIPYDNFLPRVSNEKYEKVILDARNTNMNMLRVWGGGIYENDIFYDLCDKYGILLWHDFMFACCLYPADTAMLENIKVEAIQNVKRIRNHASLALWCGNNEINAAWFDWGDWKKNLEKQSKDYADKVWTEYQSVFNKTLPDIVKEYDPQTPYRESSPVEVNGSGDMHFWGVWHVGKPITDYNTVIPQFMSEYGFQSFPEFESVKKYAPEKADWDIYSETMLLHQRNNWGNGLIKRYMDSNYRKPKDFQRLLYMSHILQADAVKIGEEAHRRNMPHCMGSLYWQLNDCWPVASWSSTDYYGHWKALSYYSQRAFAPLLVSPIEENNKLNVYIVSDKLTQTVAELLVKAIDLNGNLLYEKKQHVNIPANSSILSFSELTSSVIKEKSRNEVVIYARVAENNTVVAENTYFLAKSKEIEFPEVAFSKTIKPTAGGYEISISSNKFAKGVWFTSTDYNSFFSDNYFDLMPGVIKTIKVTTSLKSNEFEEGLKMTSIRDSY